MSLCSSGLVMAAFTTGLILSDILYSRSYRVIPHLFLGGITTALFFALCQNGYEMVNWVILAVIPFYMFVSWAFTEMKYGLHELKEYAGEERQEHEERECDVCKQPPHRCGCMRKHHKKDYEEKGPSGCHAKTRRHDSECDGSRYM